MREFIYPSIAGHAPCRECTDRSVGCHADCAKYKDWLSKLDGVKDQRQKALAYYRYQYDKIQRAESKLSKNSNDYKRRFKG